MGIKKYYEIDAEVNGERIVKLFPCTEFTGTAAIFHFMDPYDEEDDVSFTIRKVQKNEQ